jgi:hypothetical protein
MILKCRFSNVSKEPRTGVSKTTGKTYAYRDALISFHDEEGDQYIKVGIDEETFLALGLHEGAEACVRVKFYTQIGMGGNVRNQANVVSPQNAQ